MYVQTKISIHQSTVSFQVEFNNISSQFLKFSHSVEGFAWNEQFLDLNILPIICDFLDVLMMIGIFIDDMNTSE